MTKVHKMNYIQQRVTVNRHKKAVFPVQFSTFRNTRKLLHNIWHCLEVVENITTHHHLNMTSVHESLTIHLI